MTNRNDFEFKYSAPTSQERKEIESIRNSYLTQEKSSNKLEYLRKLDAKVKNIPTCISLVVGVIGLLIFGLGMAMILEWNILLWGIVISAIGIIPISLAYPIFQKSKSHLKNKYGETILRISEELLNDEN